MKFMASWFDENNFNEPNEDEKLKNENSGADGGQSESQPSIPDLENENKEEQNQTAETEDIKPNNSWYTPGGSSYTAGNPGSQGNYGTTYRYGVNAPNPVPFNTNHYSPNQPQNNNSGGYNPPTGGFNNNSGNYHNSGNYNSGGYNPYGSWQRPPQQPTPPNSPNMSNFNGSQPPKPPKKKKGATIAIATLSVVCAAAIITLSVLLAIALNDNKVPRDNNTSSTTSSTASGNAPSVEIVENDPDAMGLSTPSIIEKNLHSTVVISVYERRNTMYGISPVEVGAASGIVMSRDGYIITNWHVVINEKTGKTYDKITVKTYDGTVYENAQVIGADKDTDLAVIKVAAVNLAVPEFGDSSKLKLGDKVVAIGNAGGLSWTSTQGIVSGLARDVYEDTGYAIKCLQIDAAINPGNSGGPLLNAQGQVVGINSAKIVANGYEGLGFSIPITEAKVIIDDLVKYGYVKNRVMLGVSVIDIEQLGYEGCQIREINEDSCLVGTKVQVGDIIVKVGDKSIRTGVELRNELSKYKVGDQVTLTLLRVSRDFSKDYFTVTVTLKEYNGK